MTLTANEDDANTAPMVKRVVLTGGPCGGKSTVQTMLSDVFSNLGWKVYRVPETATTLLAGGVSFADLTAEQAYEFQKDLLQVMLRMEQTYFHLAESHARVHGQKAIVLCDRGTMDASAYIDKPLWKQILAESQWTEVELRDQRYDCVVHLVSAALGAESFYSSESNHVRSEGLELARDLDRMCREAWVGHPYYDIVDNSTDFETKCRRVIATLLRRMGLEDKRFGNTIRKRKFLIQTNDAFTWDSSSFPVASHQDFVVEHTFLHGDEGNDRRQVRIRRRTQNGVSHFNLTDRNADTGLEKRRALSGRDYDNLKSQADPRRVSIEKKRRCFLWESNYFQLDYYETPARCKGLVLLEAYLPEGSNALPPFLPIHKEITGDHQYSMSFLSLRDAHD